MPLFYRIAHPDGTMVVYGNTPAAIQDLLHEHADWPSGSYDVRESQSLESPSARSGVHWAVAVKAAGGAVELK